MQKLCIICQKPAVYIIRGTNTAYCEEHAKEFFSDTSYLAEIKDEAQRLKSFVDSQIDQLTEVKEELTQEELSKDTVLKKQSKNIRKTPTKKSSVTKKRSTKQTKKTVAKSQTKKASKKKA